MGTFPKGTCPEGLLSFFPTASIGTFIHTTSAASMEGGRNPGKKILPNVPQEPQEPNSC